VSFRETAAADRRVRGDRAKVAAGGVKRRLNAPMAPPQLAHSDEDELKRRGYVIGGVLGEGSYAKVRPTVHSCTGEADILKAEGFK